METSKYKIDIICTNCGYYAPLEIDKGKLVEKEPCPNCSNLTIKRDLNAHLRGNNRNAVNYL